jgi:hypothetical protein
MNQNGELDTSADCGSDTRNSVEDCRINADPGRVYAIIFGYEEAFNFTVICRTIVAD